MMKKVPVARRHFDTFGTIDWMSGIPKRGMMLHTDRYNWDLAKALDGYSTLINLIDIINFKIILYNDIFDCDMLILPVEVCSFTDMFYVYTSFDEICCIFEPSSQLPDKFSVSVNKAKTHNSKVKRQTPL
jgi:hypothetical protein